MCAKANRSSGGGRNGGFYRGWGHVVGCDACRSCQDQEGHVGLMKRHKWSGKPDPFPWGWPAYCCFTKLRCTSGCCITSTAPRHATPPPNLPHAPHLHLRFYLQPRQTANVLAAAVHFPISTARKATASALMDRICRDAQRSQFRGSHEAELSAGHREWIHTKAVCVDHHIQSVSASINVCMSCNPLLGFNL